MTVLSFLGPQVELPIISFFFLFAVIFTGFTRVLPTGLCCFDNIFLLTNTSFPSHACARALPYPASPKNVNTEMLSLLSHQTLGGGSSPALVSCGTTVVSYCREIYDRAMAESSPKAKGTSI